MASSGSGVFYGGIKALLCTVAFSCACLHTTAQTTKAAESKELPPPRDVKILDEHKDAKGNTIRKIEYRQGNLSITETVIIPSDAIFNVRHPINADTLDKDSVVLIVNKSKYNLEVFYKRRKIRSYKAVFGPKPLEDKRMAGDRCTPEGAFRIQSKNPNSKYDKFMLLDYPTLASMTHFNELVAHGAIPKNAQPGGDVGIHGIWKGGDDMIEMGVGWTDGCIALCNKDIEELYKFSGIGTKVFIKK
jgi:murein L,D-transpeptidase YafK